MRKMNWECSRDGCFEKKKRVKLGIFDECLPGRIGFTDIDGIVEINGACLIMEWKGAGVPVPVGQQIMFKQITATPLFTIIVVEGDAENMSVARYQLWFNKKAHKWVEEDIRSLKSVVRRWSNWARRRT